MLVLRHVRFLAVAALLLVSSKCVVSFQILRPHALLLQSRSGDTNDVVHGCSGCSGCRVRVRLQQQRLAAEKKTNGLNTNTSAGSGTSTSTSSSFSSSFSDDDEYLKVELTKYLEFRKRVGADEAMKKEAGKVVGGTKGNVVLDYVSGSPNKEITLEMPNVLDYSELDKYGFGVRIVCSVVWGLRY